MMHADEALWSAVYEQELSCRTRRDSLGHMPQIYRKGCNEPETQILIDLTEN